MAQEKSKELRFDLGEPKPLFIKDKKTSRVSWINLFKPLKMPPPIVMVSCT